MAATDGGAAAHPALVYSVQPGHAALGPEVLAVGRANATRTGTTNPHPAGRGGQAAAPRLGERQACRATSGAFAAARISGRT
jgi:hypothetical protein